MFVLLRDLHADTLPPAHRRALSPHVLTSMSISCALDDSEVGCQCICDPTSLMASDVEHSSTQLLAICIPSFEKHPLASSNHFMVESFAFVSSLYIVDINHQTEKHLAKISTFSVDHLFTLLFPLLYKRVCVFFFSSVSSLSLFPTSPFPPPHPPRPPLPPLLSSSAPSPLVASC